MFVSPTRAAFTSAVASLWAEDRVAHAQGKGFMEHQAMVASFLGPDTPYRGLIAVHGLGTGKTAVAAATIEAWCARKQDTSSPKVRIVTPAALRPGFEAELVRTNTRESCSDYAFVSQNGLSSKAIARLKDGGNVFDGSLVIVDEAHNVSRTLASDEAGSKASPTRMLYDLIRTSRRSKVLLLTATPIHNRAVELAYLVNMVAGPVVEHTVRFMDPISDHTVVTRIEDVLRADDRVDTFKVTVTSATVRLIEDARFRMPQKSDGILVPANEKRGGGGSIESVVAALASIVPCGKPSAREHELLPTDRATFDAMFVGEDGAIVNRGILSRRLLGRVSLYDIDVGNDSDAYPRVRCEEIVQVPLGEAQFKEYTLARAYEQKLESRDSGRDDDHSVYRYYSRIASNFTFPPGVRGRRVFKFEERALSVDKYDESTRRAIAELRTSGFWRDDSAIAKYAPKFAAIMDRASAPDAGKSLMYSTFRTAEGIGLFAEFLKARGWRHVEVGGGKSDRRLVFCNADSVRGNGPCFVTPRPGDRDGRALLALFNGRRGNEPPEIEARFVELAALLGVDVSETANVRGETVRAVLLSRSGAEGLNLSEVRQVHMLEPNWNAIQLKQVAGRAIRMHSHGRLPEPDRDVAIYAYVAVVPDAVRDTDPTIERDSGVSTDEFVAASAARKGVVATRVRDVLRAVAVDCPVHAPQDARACYVPPTDRDGDLVPARVVQDRDDALGPGRRLRVQVEEDGGESTGTARTREVIVFQNSSDVFDAGAFDASGGLEAVGFITKAGTISWDD